VSRYRVSPKAREDLKEIYRHIVQENPTAARRLRHALYARFRLLATQPLMGQTCPNLRPDLRAFTFGNYVIFYLPSTRGIEIERVLHGARDIEPLF